MKKEIKELKEQAEHAKALLAIGAISYEEAKEKVSPYINEVNRKSKEIAKKYNQRPKFVSIRGFLR